MRDVRNLEDYEKACHYECIFCGADVGVYLDDAEEPTDSHTNGVRGYREEFSDEFDADGGE